MNCPIYPPALAVVVVVIIIIIVVRRRRRRRRLPAAKRGFVRPGADGSPDRTPGRHDH